MVALRKESVDRNTCYLDNIEINEAVALRKESVDRNKSSWQRFCKIRVALRKESVDRNGVHAILSAIWRKSLSARRAWIEIMGEGAGVSPGMVALRKESVDRNTRIGNTG